MSARSRIILTNLPVTALLVFAVADDNTECFRILFWVAVVALSIWFADREEKRERAKREAQ